MKHARLLALLGVALATSASAHLMVAQHGTLNFVGDGAFLVMSLPASVFPLADEDHDGRLSSGELQRHTADLAATVQGGLRLLEATAPRPLEGLMFSLEEDGAQVVLLGRYALSRPDAETQFELQLFGDQPEQLTFTRGAASQFVVLTPTRRTVALFPSATALLLDHVRLGVEHIVTGFDHLLFLLVVLAAGGGWRRVALALSCFTAGHAVTLALSVVGGLSAPASVVEPAIAATIVGMAAFDWRLRRKSLEPGAGWRLALVFGCALIHGLGLAASLTELGVDRAHLAPVLVGFNLGVELGQLAVCVAAALLVGALLRLAGLRRAPLAQGLASAAAMLIGSVWWVQRVL